MIYCLTGKIIKKTLDSVVISCGGVGYFVQIPATTGEALPPAGQEGTVYTIMNVTENDVSLYGFAAEEQRDCFKMLTGVTGVGPKAALSILSIMTPEKIALAASSGDHKAFTKAAGVGPKLAQRITLELKDKVGKGLAAGTGFSGNVAAPAPRSAPAQAVAALVSLGYAPSDAAAAVARVDETLSVQEIITIASLIEEETDGTDQANIASVIYNRLEGSGNKQGTYGLLQIDASLLYALPDHTGPITSADMQTDSPYNLYQNAGLPPTPISNPGLASIDAALNPNSTDYYYYALGTDGKHHFSTTLAEHNAFVNSSSYGG